MTSASHAWQRFDAFRNCLPPYKNGLLNVCVEAAVERGELVSRKSRRNISLSTVWSGSGWRDANPESFCLLYRLVHVAIADLFLAFFEKRIPLQRRLWYLSWPKTGRHAAKQKISGVKSDGRQTRARNSNWSLTGALRQSVLSQTRRMKCLVDYASWSKL